MPKSIANMTQGPNGEMVPINSVFMFGNLGALWSIFDEFVAPAVINLGTLLQEIAIPIGSKFTLLSWEIATKVALATIQICTSNTPIDAAAGLVLPLVAAEDVPAALPADWTLRTIVDIPAAGTAVWDKGLTIENTTGAILYLDVWVPTTRIGVAGANNAITQFFSQTMAYMLS